MPISVDWNDKSKSLILSRFRDPWKIAELMAARMTWHRMIKSVDHAVPILIDLSESASLPKGALRHLTAMHRTPHPRQSHIYIMGISGSYEALYPHFSDGVVDPGKSVRLIDSVESILFP